MFIFTSVFSFIVLCLSICGIIYWTKQINSWTINNYPTSNDYMFCLGIGWASIMMTIGSGISFIMSLICVIIS